MRLHEIGVLIKATDMTSYKFSSPKSGLATSVENSISGKGYYKINSSSDNSEAKPNGEPSSSNSSAKNSPNTPAKVKKDKRSKKSKKEKKKSGDKGWNFDDGYGVTEGWKADHGGEKQFGYRLSNPLHNHGFSATQEEKKKMDNFPDDIRM